ncbi:phosphoribosyltransferase [Paenibacillus rhizophilus]|uniref:phosphoribosyltransferase n=1 Tax=Paenibacillus rhizophilus TaxID=1850366 RepID=UPI000F5C2795
MDSVTILLSAIYNLQYFTRKFREILCNMYTLSEIMFIANGGSMEQYLKEFLSINNLSEESISNDKRLQGLYERIPQWLSEIEEPHRPIFLLLLKYLNYFNREKVHNTFVSVYERFRLSETSWENTIYAPITPKRPIYNGTNEFFSIFREVCNPEVRPTRIAFQLRDFLKMFNTSEVSNIVLIDDIIGTGTTFRDFLNPLIEEFSHQFKNKKIYVLCLVAHPKGINKMNSIGKQHGIEIHCINGYGLSKAFEQGMLFKTEKERIAAKQIVKFYEEKVAKRNDDIMGFQNSEGLVAFFHNTPNNTLSTFWEQEAKVTWHPIFPRTIRGEELPIENSVNTLEAIKKRDIKKNNLAKVIYSKIKEKLTNGTTR